MANKSEAIVIVLDVGPSAGQVVSATGDTFLQNAQLCATNIIQRKVLSKSKDEIGIIILGSEETNNSLADDESYSNIEVVCPLQTASWSMVHAISKYKKCTITEGDWFEALIVAVDFMKTATEEKLFKEKKIVLLSNCSSEINDDEADIVINALEREKAHVIAIGPVIYENSMEEVEASTENYPKGMKLINRICEEVPNSVICGFEDAIPQLSYFEMKKTRPAPWKAVMDIGSSIKIPIVAYKKVLNVQATLYIPNCMFYLNKISENQRMTFQDILINPSEDFVPSVSSQHPSQHPSQYPSQHPSQQEASQSFNASVPSSSEQDRNNKFSFLDKDRTFQTIGDDATPVDVADVIEGYMFGTTVVPVTEDDKPNLTYESGPRCLSVLGFTNRKNIPSYYFKGEGCYQVFPQKEENSMRAFSALIQALDSKDMVAIARKVYNTNNTPVICALIPMITPELQSFVQIELPYGDDVAHLLFPPIVTEKDKPSTEQLTAVDQLITSMDLMEVDREEGENEPFNPLKTMDPYEQHFLSIIAKKALNGDKFIHAVEVNETVKQLLSPKENVLNAAKPALSRIKALFTLQAVTPKEGARKAAADVFKRDDSFTIAGNHKALQLPQDDKKVQLHIGTVQPQNDFNNLLNQGVPLEEACSLLIQVIIDMISKAFDEDDYEKPFKCLIHMRNECSMNKPTIYNEWIIKFKNDYALEKPGFWSMVVSDMAGLITSSESNKSNVTEEEAKSFLQMKQEIDDAPPMPTVDEDMDDLINQM